MLFGIYAQKVTIPKICRKIQYQKHFCFKFDLANIPRTFLRNLEFRSNNYQPQLQVRPGWTRRGRVGACTTKGAFRWTLGATWSRSAATTPPLARSPACATTTSSCGIWRKTSARKRFVHTSQERKIQITISKRLFSALLAQGLILATRKLRRPRNLQVDFFVTSHIR